MSFKNVHNVFCSFKTKVAIAQEKDQLANFRFKRTNETSCIFMHSDKNDFKNAALYITRKFEKQIRDKAKMVCYN